VHGGGGSQGVGVRSKSCVCSERHLRPLVAGAAAPIAAARSAGHPFHAPGVRWTALGVKACDRGTACSNLGSQGLLRPKEADPQAAGHEDTQWRSPPADDGAPGPSAAEGGEPARGHARCTRGRSRTPRRPRRRIQSSKCVRPMLGAPVHAPNPLSILIQLPRAAHDCFHTSLTPSALRVGNHCSVKDNVSHVCPWTSRLDTKSLRRRHYSDWPFAASAGVSGWGVAHGCCERDWGGAGSPG
jgi:hypothetical protein